MDHASGSTPFLNIIARGWLHWDVRGVDKLGPTFEDCLLWLMFMIVVQIQRQPVDNSVNVKALYILIQPAWWLYFQAYAGSFLNIDNENRFGNLV